MDSPRRAPCETGTPTVVWVVPLGNSGPRQVADSGGGARPRKGWRQMGGTAAGDFRVQDNPAEGRYEAFVGVDLAGFVAYDKLGDQVIFTHTLVEPAFE